MQGTHPAADAAQAVDDDLGAALVLDQASECGPPVIGGERVAETVGDGLRQLGGRCVGRFGGRAAVEPPEVEEGAGEHDGTGREQVSEQQGGYRLRDDRGIVGLDECVHVALLQLGGGSGDVVDVVRGHRAQHHVARGARVTYEVRGDLRGRVLGEPPEGGGGGGGVLREGGAAGDGSVAEDVRDDRAALRQLAAEYGLPGLGIEAVEYRPDHRPRGLAQQECPGVHHPPLSGPLLMNARLRTPVYERQFANRGSLTIIREPPFANRRLRTAVYERLFMNGHLRTGIREPWFANRRLRSSVCERLFTNSPLSKRSG